MKMIINFTINFTQSVNIDGQDFETVNTYKYQGVNTGNKLDWSLNSDCLDKKT